MQHLIEGMVGQFERGLLSRRELIAQITAVAAFGGVAMAVEPAAATPLYQANGLNHLALRVTNVPRSRDFYVKHLGFTVTRDGSTSCFLTAGQNFLALFRGETPRMDHYCISVEGFEIGEAVAKLKEAGLNPSHPSGSDRVYFDDPDGLVVQLSADNHTA